MLRWIFGTSSDFCRFSSAIAVENLSEDLWNQAYYPYCSYNDAWSCPVPPAQNRLKVRIEAGEENFH